MIKDAVKYAEEYKYVDINILHIFIFNRKKQGKQFAK